MGRELRTPVSYDADFYRWTTDQARLLRSGQMQAADLATIAEELETFGRSEAAALRSSLRLVVLHLLKLTYQPARATRSWRSTIVRERNNAERTLKENPSLKSRLAALFGEAYEDGRREAIAVTGLDGALCPEVPAMTVAEVLDRGHWPPDSRNQGGGVKRHTREERGPLGY